PRCVSPSRDDFERERDALAAADAQGHEPSPQAIATHGMDEAGGQNGARRPDWMAMRDRAALDVDDVLRQAEIARNDDGDGGERFVDFHRLDVAEPPAGAVERLAHRRDRAEAEHPRL